MVHLAPLAVSVASILEATTTVPVIFTFSVKGFASESRPSVLSGRGG
jgi:hypothetical protein